MENSVVKNKLKSLCCGNGWSYGVFWRYDQRNSILLTFDDAYYEERIGAVVESMLLEVHMLGEGIVGQAAFTGRQQWLFFDAQSSDWKSTCDNEVLFKESMFDCQTSSGIKTIAVLPVQPWGVVQFGSTQKILETVEFLNQAQLLFQDVANADGMIPLHHAPLLFEHEANDNIGLIGSIVASRNYSNRNHSQEHSRTSSVSGTQHVGIKSILEEPSNSKSQQQISAQPQQLSSRPVSPSNSDVEAACVIPSSCESSIIASLKSHLSSEMTLPDADLPSKGVVSPAFCEITVPPEFQNDSTFNPLDSLGEFFGIENFEPQSFNSLITSSLLTTSNQESEVIFPDISTSELTFPKGNKPADFIENLSEFFTMDDLSQWLTHSPSHGTGGTENMLNSTHSQSMGVSSISSSVVEGDLFTSNPIKHTENSGQSSVTNTLDSSVQEELFHVNGTNVSTAMAMNHGHVKAVDFCKNQVIPIESGTHSAITAAESDCVSELIVSSMTPRRGLFSELGLHELFDGIANSSSVTSSLEDGQSVTKRRKIDSPLVNCTRVELSGLPSPVGSLTSMQDRVSSLLPKKEFPRKSQVGLWIDDSYSINVGDGVGAKPKRSERPAKASRRRASPGESAQPRPKDRQQIQDRIKELRGIIPNGQKSSIDSLLDRTIKYMVFLQSATKYADKLIQADEPKLIDQENGVILKDGKTDSCSRGATWAYEVGSQATVCPIIVEDLSSPGQMQIEMLCEDQGLFLEIADVIRGIGLNILKGLMEVQGTKIRACFAVEVNRHVTRMDIFWTLVQFVQDTTTTGKDTTDQLKIGTDGQIASLSNYQQSLVSLPIGTDTTDQLNIATDGQIYSLGSCQQHPVSLPIS